MFSLIISTVSHNIKDTKCYMFKYSHFKNNKEILLVYLSVCLDLFSFIDHLSVMFGEELPPWDVDRKYHPQNLQVRTCGIIEQCCHTWNIILLFCFSCGFFTPGIILDHRKSRYCVIIFVLFFFSYNSQLDRIVSPSSTHFISYFMINNSSTVF